MNFHLNIHSCVADIYLQALVHMQLSVLIACDKFGWDDWLTPCPCPQDRERREDELNELRHILDENHSAVTNWETECRNKAKVQDSYSISSFGSLKLSVLQDDLFFDIY